MLVPLQRQHTHQRRHREGAVHPLVVLHKGAPKLRIINGLRHGEVRARAHLAVEALDLLIEVGTCGIARHGNGEGGAATHVAPCQVHAVVEAADDAREAN